MAAQVMKVSTNKKLRELKLSFTEQIEDLQEQLGNALNQLSKLSNLNS